MDDCGFDSQTRPGPGTAKSDCRETARPPVNHPGSRFEGSPTWQSQTIRVWDLFMCRRKEAFLEEPKRQKGREGGHMDRGVDEGLLILPRWSMSPDLCSTGKLLDEASRKEKSLNSEEINEPIGCLILIPHQKPWAYVIFMKACMQ